MDFQLYYTEEQEQFRKVVQEWLEANAPQVELPEETEMTEEHFEIYNQWRRRLGAQGWLAITWPKELGGGGLTSAHAVVLNEELAKRNLSLPTDLGLTLAAPAIMVHGTEEQKARFIPPILKGEVNTWQCFTEPEAGSDLASLKTRGVRDGDDFIINGSKQFVGSRRRPDFLYTLVNTAPDAPRHENLSMFMIPADLPGVSWAPMDLIAGGGKQFLYFDNVRVPRDYLIGEENKGWLVANTTLELEHGGRGTPGGGDRGRGALLPKVIAHLRTRR